MSLYKRKRIHFRISSLNTRTTDSTLPFVCFVLLSHWVFYCTSRVDFLICCSWSVGLHELFFFRLSLECVVATELQNVTVQFCWSIVRHFVHFLCLHIPMNLEVWFLNIDILMHAWANSQKKFSGQHFYRSAIFKLI